MKMLLYNLLQREKEDASSIEKENSKKAKNNEKAEEG